MPDAPLRRAKLLWSLVPLLAFLFSCSAGRGWPYHPGPGFPGGGGSPSPAAVFSVYSPGARTMRLRATFRLAEPGVLPALQVTIGNAEASTAPLHAAGGVLTATAPLPLAGGVNTVRLTLGGRPFQIESLSLTQNIFNGGNLLFALTLGAMAAACLLASRALGANGPHAFCAASLLGFLLLTSTGTLLSFVHGLTGLAWAAALLAGSAALAAVAAWTLRRRPVQPLPPKDKSTLRPWEAATLLALAGPVFVLHTLLPVAQFDDLMYHGPRTGYWMGIASALPFPSHDDRLAVFPIGGDLLNACGAILSGSEMPGKFLVGLGFPLTLFAMFALLKTAGVRAGVAMGMVVVYATAPLVILGGVGIKPDLWLVLLGVITLHWVLVARRGDPAMSRTVAAGLAAAAAGAAFGVKWTAAPLILLVPFALGARDWRQRFAPVAGVFALTLALGGAAPALFYNWRTNHHPFGPAAMRAWHQPAPGLHPIRVQLERLPFLLFAPPPLPEAARATVQRWEAAAADFLGATEPLSMEHDARWPGRFTPTIRENDDHFSLGWDFVAIGVLAGLWLFRREPDPERRSTFLLAFGLCAAFTLAVVTQTRWQVAAGLPDRFLLPGLAWGLIAIAGPVDRLVAAWRPAGGLLAALLALHVWPCRALAAIPLSLGVGKGWQAPATIENKAPFNVLSRQLPPGRTVLLLADQSAREYPLFLAREGYANRILPWGKAPYESSAFERALQPGAGVDTVVLTGAKSIGMIWDPPLDARPFVRDMDARADFTRFPGPEELVVYVRRAPAAP